MSKASEEGVDLRSSENLATAFLMLGITESPASALLTFKIAEVESTKIPEDEYEPATYQAALKSPQAEKWKEAMQQEWQALIENETFDIVKENQHTGASGLLRRVGRSKFMEVPISCKWIYQRKIIPDGFTRYKARLVIKGYEQKAGIDYDETYAPVSKLATFRLLLALAAQYGWNVDHMDVVTAFLNLKIDQGNICISLPPGIKWLESSTIKVESLVLRKALYRLKQAPWLWYEDIDGFLCSIGFKQSAEDPNLYLQPGVLLLLYVDDLLIAYNRTDGHRIKQLLHTKYKMSDLGPTRRFLGIEIEKKEDGFCISQQAYIDTIVRRFGLLDAKPAKMPLDSEVDLNNPHCKDKSVDRKEYLLIVGSLMYAALGSRLDIAFSVTALSHYVTLERPVNVGVTVILNWSCFLIVTKEMGHTRSSPAFS